MIFLLQLNMPILNALNFVQRDSLSVLNGQMTMDMKGTTIDDVYGTLNLKMHCIKIKMTVMPSKILRSPLNLGITTENYQS